MNVMIDTVHNAIGQGGGAEQGGAEQKREEQSRAKE